MNVNGRKRMNVEEAVLHSGGMRNISATDGGDHLRSGIQASFAKQKDKKLCRSIGWNIKLGLGNGRKHMGRRVKDMSPRSKHKKKPSRTYNRYIQKKFSPSIMTDVIVNLSKTQAAWIIKTGFGELLSFRMETYTHRLGYNVVEAFDNDQCILNLVAGVIKINERTVNRVIGMPLGKEVIKCNARSASNYNWAEQFDGRASSMISPMMVRDKILGTREADANFKWNFLIMIYNFFIESNQNRFLNRDILKFSGNIEKCSNYNWCKLLIEKLKNSHAYWVADKKRNFAGALPFLIYLYVSKVQNKETVYVPLTSPTYRGWSDMLLRERQKFDSSQKYDSKDVFFGVGELVNLQDGTEDHNMIESNGVETNPGCKSNEHLTTKHLGYRNEIGNVDVENKDEDSPEFTAMDCDDTIHDVESYIDDAGLDVVRSLDCDNHKNTVFYKSDVDINHEVAQKEVTDDDGLQINKGKDKLVDEMIIVKGVDLENTTQDCVDGEIVKYFDENTYMDDFAQNLKEFVEVYSKCLNNFEVAFALYPHNARLAGLKKDYMQYFKLFRDASPIAKNLPVGNLVDNIGPSTGHETETDFVPNFSLGLSQMTPKNLGIDLEGVVNSHGKTGYVVSTYTRKECNEVNDISYASKTIELVGNIHQENMLNLRPRRGLKSSHLCRSPYVSRVVDVAGHTLTNEERNIWDWIFLNKRNNNDYLFKWKNKMCTKEHFQSMEHNKMIESTVIDTWSYLLNENETLRADTSPLRIFMTIAATHGPLNRVVCNGDRDAIMERNVLFLDNMDIVMATVDELHNKHHELKDFDLFFFPLYDRTHLYVICYDVMKPRCLIIDNRVPGDDLEETYGDLPARLHSLFCQWISIYNLPKEREIVNLKPKVVRLGWQTTMNAVDCGIFTMRHMETFMGCLHAWKAGLRHEKDNQCSLLNKLRIIYCHKILTWTENQNRGLILKRASELAMSKKVVG